MCKGPELEGHIHTHTCIYIHRYTHTRVYTHTGTHICIYTHAYIHTGTHIYTHTYRYTAHICSHIYARTQVHMHMHIYIYPQVHTHMHIYTRHIRIDLALCLLLWGLPMTWHLASQILQLLERQVLPLEAERVWQCYQERADLPR